MASPEKTVKAKKCGCICPTLTVLACFYGLPCRGSLIRHWGEHAAVYLGLPCLVSAVDERMTAPPLNSQALSAIVHHKLCPIKVCILGLGVRDDSQLRRLILLLTPNRLELHRGFIRWSVWA